MRILLDARRNVLMVERGPFLEQGGGNSAYVMDGSSAVKRPVRVGASSLGAVEILDGAREGDRIVVSGADAFGNAERVRISGRMNVRTNGNRSIRTTRSRHTCPPAIWPMPCRCGCAIWSSSLARTCPPVIVVPFRSPRWYGREYLRADEAPAFIRVR